MTKIVHVSDTCHLLHHLSPGFAWPGPQRDLGHLTPHYQLDELGNLETISMEPQPSCFPEFSTNTNNGSTPHAINLNPNQAAAQNFTKMFEGFALRHIPGLL